LKGTADNMAKRSLSVPRRRGSTDPSADAALAKLGYASELPRNLSMLSVLGMYVYTGFYFNIDSYRGDYTS
jgi:hypothetical protein